MISIHKNSFIYKFIYFGTLFGKMGINPDVRCVVWCRICLLVLSKVIPIELMRRLEQASLPSHWRPKQPLRSKQKVGWTCVGRSVWQQLNRKKIQITTVRLTYWKVFFYDIPRTSSPKKGRFCWYINYITWNINLGPLWSL